MPRRSSLVILAATGLCLAAALLGPGPMRTPVAVALLTILPGAALTQLFFGRSLRDWTERVATTVGLGLAAIVLGGLLLNETAGITRTSVACFAAGLTVAAVVADAVLRLNAVEPSAPANPRVRVSILDAVLFAGAIALVVVAIGYARTPLSARGAQGYTVLWIDSKAGNLELGVKSQELQRQRYRLDVTDGRQLVHRWRIALSPGRNWGTSLGSRPKGTAVSAVLYIRRAQGWVAYRRVRDVQ